MLWVSAEPQVGLIDLRHLRGRNGTVTDALSGVMRDAAGTTVALPGAVGWVVAGGESGPLADGKSRPAARPADLDWFRLLRDQCADTHAAFWVKQAGTIAARRLGAPGAGTELGDLPADLAIRQLPRAA